jgi:hypothetical protein
MIFSTQILPLLTHTHTHTHTHTDSSLAHTDTHTHREILPLLAQTHTHTHARARSLARSCARRHFLPVPHSIPFLLLTGPFSFSRVQVLELGAAATKTIVKNNMATGTFVVDQTHKSATAQVVLKDNLGDGPMDKQEL